MRISDWSSDVCSSDLPGGCDRRFEDMVHNLDADEGQQTGDRRHEERVCISGREHQRSEIGDRKSTRPELQSLMRISYAVFCLKKKTKNSKTKSKIVQIYNTNTKSTTDMEKSISDNYQKNS